jgi:hypothetical protein
MTMKNRILFYALMLLTMFINCEKVKIEESEILISPLPLLGYGSDSLACTNSFYAKIENPLDTTFLINSIEEYNQFKSYVSSLEIANWPQLDFEKKTLVAGIGILNTSCAKIIPEEFRVFKENSELTINICIAGGHYQAFSAFTYWFLIDKLEKISGIKLTIIKIVND